MDFSDAHGAPVQLGLGLADGVSADRHTVALSAARDRRQLIGCRARQRARRRSDRHEVPCSFCFGGDDRDRRVVVLRPADRDAVPAAQAGHALQTDSGEPRRRKRDRGRPVPVVLADGERVVEHVALANHEA